MAGSDALAAGADPKLFLETYSPEAYFDAFCGGPFPLAGHLLSRDGRNNSLEFYNLEQDRFGTVDLHAGDRPVGPALGNDKLGAEDFPDHHRQQAQAGFT